MEDRVQPQARPADSPTRKAPNADAPGSYTPVMCLDPGETVVGTMFFTGYGKIAGAKMVFYPATQIFEIDGCVIKFRDLQQRAGSNRSDFVTREFTGNDQGATIAFPLWPQPDGSSVDYFFEVPGNDRGTLRLHTENVTQVKPGDDFSAPLSFRLRTRKTARAGTYPLTFVFTYFNGANWLTVSLGSTFTVRNILQRHENGFGIAAVVAAVATILAAGLTAIDVWDKVVGLAMWLHHF